MKYGYLPVEKHVESSSFVIDTLPGLQDYKTIEATWPFVKDGWSYPPWEADSRFEVPQPLRPAPVFGFHPSHEIVLKTSTDEADDRLKFLILIHGFLNGLHLLPEGWIHFQRTAIKPGESAIFIIRNNEEGAILELILQRYCSLSLDNRKRCYGLVHWFLMAQEYVTQHDMFSAQYLVADAAHALAQGIDLIGRRIPHSQRIPRLCEALGLVTPDWAQPEADGQSYLSRLRNEFFHEALFVEQPIGFGHPVPNVTFGLRCINELFVLRLIGLDSSVAEYPNHITRMTYLLELKR